MTVECAGDFHVWTHGEPVCRCGSRTVEDYEPRDPSLRDVLAKLDSIEGRLIQIKQILDNGVCQNGGSF